MRKEIFVAVLVSISYILFSFFLSNMSVDKIVNLQNYFLKSMITKSPIDVLSIFINPIIAMVLLTLGFALLTSYASTEKEKKEEKKINIIKNPGFISGIVGAISVLILMHFSIASIFIAISLIALSFFIISLSRTYFSELKRWKNFRVGSNALSRVLLFFNVFVTIGILLAVFLNLNYYQNSFVNEFAPAVKNMVSAQLTSMINTQVEGLKMSTIAAIDKTYPNLTTEQRQVMVDEIKRKTNELKNNLITETERTANDMIKKTIEESPIFKTYIAWLPLTIAVMVFVVLEFLRLFLPYVAGIFSAILIRIFERME